MTSRPSPLGSQPALEIVLHPRVLHFAPEGAGGLGGWQARPVQRRLLPDAGGSNGFGEYIVGRHFEAAGRLLPTWRRSRAELNRAPLAHEDWEY
jgi:hypothetical protein